MATAYGSLPHLLPPSYKRTIANWLEEDCPTFDYGGFVVGDSPAVAHLYCKSSGMLAGVPFFNEVFRQLDCTVEWHYPEGTFLNCRSDSNTTTTTNGNQPNSNPDSASGSKTQTPRRRRIHTATLHGPTNALLLGERLALNILARTSGIATTTSHTLHTLRAAGLPPQTVLAGTRKTTPGFRLCEKYAIAVGGGDMHRMDLSAMTMIKDNHVRACSGDIGRAVETARRAAGFAAKVEVECRDEGEAVEAVRAGADVVMLDNMTAGEVRRVSRLLRERFGGGVDSGSQLRADSSNGDGEKAGAKMGAQQRRAGFLIEVSGGLTLDSFEKGEGQGYLTRDVDVISTSSIHQGVPHVDFSLKIVEGEAAAA